MLIDRYKAHKIIPAMKYPAGGRGDVLLAQPAAIAQLFWIRLTISFN
jgi:hypothetical protein